jgi:hypothetical protein
LFWEFDKYLRMFENAQKAAERFKPFLRVGGDLVPNWSDTKLKKVRGALYRQLLSWHVT